MSANAEQSTELKIDPALSVSDAKAMSDRFRAGLRRTINKALGDKAETTSDERKSLLFNFAYRAAHARQKVNKQLIEGVLDKSDEELITATRALPTAFTLREAVTLIKEAEGKHRDRHDKMFKPGQYRRYYRMPKPRKEDLGRTAQQITAWLEREGFKDIDYIAGTCLDDRNQTRRIGRVLPDEQYKSAFANDPDRQGGNLMMVISRHPYDLIRMSTGRGWQSCMTKKGMYWEYVPKEVKEGSMVAYLVKQSDPEILDPMSRSTIKPFYNAKGETLMMAGPTYGMGSGAFKAAVQAVVDREYNNEIYGNFELPRTVYDDGLRRHQRRIDPGMKDWTAEQWIDHLGLEVEQQGDRKVIKGNLNLANYELEEVPDFTAYDVDGDMMLDGNKLQHLGKLPYKVTGNFSAIGNQLYINCSTLKEVGGNYIVDDNKIGTLIVGPEKVGGKYSARNNRLDSMNGLPEVLEGDLLLSSNNITNFANAPKRIGGMLDMARNKLQSLDGMPQVGSKQNPKPVQFGANRLTSLEGLDGKVWGTISVVQNLKLTSLTGCPATIDGGFDAANCALTSLEGGPQSVTQHYSVGNNNLTSLKGAPTKVGALFEASGNTLENLMHMPAETGQGIRIRNAGLTSLKGMPWQLKGALDLSGNKLTSLRGMSRRIEGHVVLAENQITSLEGMATVIKGSLNMTRNNLTTTRGIAQTITGSINLSRNKLERLEDMPRIVRGNLELGSNELTSTDGLPEEVHNNLVLSYNPIVDATRLPRLVSGYVDLRNATTLRHLPGRMPKDCTLIATQHHHFRPDQLPARDFPPNSTNDNAKTPDADRKPGHDDPAARGPRFGS
ncbi:MAG: hypothetical protein Alpg2KO_09050 [Alphaproteobacteria bacterium]